MFLIGSSAVGNLYTCCYLLNNRVICPSLQFWLKKKKKERRNSTTKKNPPVLQRYLAETLQQNLKTQQLSFTRSSSTLLKPDKMNTEISKDSI